MKSSVEDSTKVWRKKQGGPASHLILTSPHSAPAGPRWNAEGREALKKHGRLCKEVWGEVGS